MEAARSDESNRANNHTWKNWLFSNDDKDGHSAAPPTLSSASFKRAGGFLSGMLDSEEKEEEKHDKKQRSKNKKNRKSKSLPLGKAAGHGVARGRSKSMSSTASEKHSDDSDGGGSSSDDGAYTSSSEDGDEAQEEELDPENLLWEAQMALISHEYRSALKKLKKAVRHGSASACLSLGNILSKGLSCSEHDKKHNHDSIQANIPQAAKYYIQGLSLANEQSQPDLANDIHDEEHDQQQQQKQQQQSNLLNTEVVQDIAHGLCVLYRHGKIRPEHEESPVLRPRVVRRVSSKKHTHSDYNKDVGEKRSSGSTDEKEKGEGGASMLRKESMERRTCAWERGGQASQPLITKLEGLLGLSLPQQDFDAPLTEEPASISVSSGPKADSPTRTSKKNVSFSRLPAPKHRSSSSLDAVSSRQARSAIIHLYYISALCSFSLADISASRQSWEKIVSLAEEEEGKGTGSKEADEIAEKAKVRLGMLENAVVPIGNEKVQAKMEEIPGPGQLLLSQLLSPPVDPSSHSQGGNKEMKGFDFSSFSGQGAAEAVAVAADTGKSSSSASSSSHLPGASASSLSSSSPTNAKASTSKGVDEKQPSLPAQPQPRALRTVSSTSQNGSQATANASKQQRKPKFSIPDSPTSTVRSYSSVKGKGRELQDKSGGAGFLSVSAVNGKNGLDLKGKGKQRTEAPWLIRSLRSSSSSTSVSQLQQSQPGGTEWSRIPKDRQQSAAPSSRINAPSPALLPTATRRSTQAPLFRPSIRKSSTHLNRIAAPPSLAISDPSTSNLNYITPSISSHTELRENATSVASLPHYSTSNNGPGRSHSAAHMLLNRSRGSTASLAPGQNRGGFGDRQRKGSNASLASMASFSSLAGVQKSFSSLRSFFTSSTTLNRYIGDNDAESVLDEEDEDNSFGKEQEEETDAAEKLKKRLVAVAERHDKAVAEIEAQEAQWGTEEYGEEDVYGDEEEEGRTEESPGPPSFESNKTRTRTTSGDLAPGVSGPRPIPVSSPTAAMAAAGSSPRKPIKPLSLSMSIPSSSLLQPTRKIDKPSFAPLPAALPGTPSSHQTTTSNPNAMRRTPLKARRDFHNREFYQRDPTSASITPQASTTNLQRSHLRTGSSSASTSPASGMHTPFSEQQHEQKELPGPLKIDPLLAALESASRVNVKSRCAVCGTQGVNFPGCNKCGIRFCSRECRIASGGEEGRRLGKHVC